MDELTQAKLRQVLEYDSETGVFTRLSFSGSYAGGSAKLGPVTSSPDERGYLRIRVYGKKYRAHRLAWLYVYGTFPSKGIDHINGNKLDNRIENLREADQTENSQNRVAWRNSTSRYLGVSYYAKTKKWVAQIKSGADQIFLGYFSTPEAANAAYKQAKATLHTFNPIPRMA